MFVERKETHSVPIQTVVSVASKESEVLKKSKIAVLMQTLGSSEQA